MAHILLSGVGGSTNWFPLVYPLAGIVVILYAGDFIIKLIKKRRLYKENQLQHGLHTADDAGDQIAGDPNPRFPNANN